MKFTYAFPPGGLPRQDVSPEGAAIFTEATGLPEHEIDTLARLLADVSEASDRKTACEGEY